MKSVNLLLRRAHLYLGLLLLPWMLIYAISTVFFNHGEHFRQTRPADQQWTALWEKDYTVELPTGPDAVRETARRILNEQGLAGAFGAQRQGTRLTINLPNFRQPMRVVFDGEQKKLRAEKRPTTGVEIFMRLHQRVGYGQAGGLTFVWAFIVDLFCVSTLVWIATGVYLWWKLSATRAWGFLALGGGVASILILVGTL